jgi:O-acetyl-ADP-ribose deacetylase (regulator of RNase III)
VGDAIVLHVASIRYLVGDATDPHVDGHKVIAHVCNDRGGWGRGFVRAISARWGEPEKAYRLWYRDRRGNDFGLGAVQVVQVMPDVWVANLVAQHGVVTSRSTRPPIRYEAVRQSLDALAEQVLVLGASVRMPRIGCGLAGGDWGLVEPIVKAGLVDRGISVTVYNMARST